MRRLSSTIVCLAALAAAVGFTATAPGVASARPAFSISTKVSPNWAGYVLSAQSTTFTSITATWKQPRAFCAASTHGSGVSFWVGLGGSTPGAKALEQAGTASTCGAGGVATYHAWFEVVPQPPVTTDVVVFPGDTITASVNVVDGGATALFQLKNRTRHSAFTARVPLTDPPDLSSADWIAEAPTKCLQAFCLPVPLQQFGSVSFSRIAALGNGIGGTLTHSGWKQSTYQLVPSTVLVSGPARTDTAAGAVTTGLAPDGRSFDVVWVPNNRGGSF
jgi:Peptidase A4 family